MQKKGVSVIAHRGLSLEAPENTLKSFQKAITIGVDYIECDLHLSKDGEIVVIHDESLKRTTGVNGKVKDFTVNQLAEIDAGEGEHIPTLMEVIKLCKGKVNLQLEIKDVSLAPQLIDLLDRHVPLNQVLISSFIHKELDIIKNLNFRVACATLDPTGVSWVTSWVKPIGIIYNSKGRQMDCTHPFHRVVNPHFIRIAHAVGLFVNPWTVDDPKRMRTLLNWGVDGIITNESRQLLGILRDLGLRKESKAEQ